MTKPGVANPLPAKLVRESGAHQLLRVRCSLADREKAGSELWKHRISLARKSGEQRRQRWSAPKPPMRY